ncbi:hypothetical protein TruAng_007845 [Truncatella angustata]|nr:hypothetical protein TruAng_007845 [Truncatella angustata]
MAASRRPAPSSPGDFNHDEILFSARPSPTPQGSPWPDLAKRPSEMHLKLPEAASPPSSPTSASRPIAIELPTIKKSTPSSSSVYTPPAPLSARGDLPGGYFPFHEDQARVYRSHPFHLDASKARQKSIQDAQACSPDCLPLPSAPPVTGLAPSARVPLPVKMPSQTTAPPPKAMAGRNTPVASYMPSGAHANPLPMGKYYPSNYENRQPEQHLSPNRPPVSVSPSTGIKSESHVPTLRADGPAHSRQESEAKRRLQQYQRDMIAQATLALSGGNVNAAARNAISLRNMGFTGIPTKPSKPNLMPLGSPGPVTPLDLETNDDDYLGVRSGRSEDQPHMEEVARAIRAEEERRRREGARSPALSPVF